MTIIEKKALYLSVKVLSMRVLIGDTIFFCLQLETGLPFQVVTRATWRSSLSSSEKGVPSFLSYFKTLSIGLAPGIKPATFHSAVKRSTIWANPAAVKEDSFHGGIFNVTLPLTQDVT